MSQKNIPIMTPLFPKEPPLECPAFTKNAIMTGSARQAWRLFLRWYQTQGAGDVLLPAYIGYTDREGSGVFDPVRDSGLGYRFYTVDGQLNTSTEVLRAELEKGGIGVLLVVHWFGLPHVNLLEVRALCDAFGVLLIEDCAHVQGPIAGSQISFQGSVQLGHIGDAAFYSLHKTYGGDSGGFLLWNRELQGAAQQKPEQVCSPEVLSAVLRTDIPSLAGHRRTLYQVWVEGFSEVSGLEVMFPEVSEYVPHSCAVRITAGFREKLYFAMMNQGVPLTALYYRLIPELEESAYPDGFLVSREILNFPVHQGVRPELALQLVDMTKATLKALRS